MKVRGSGGSLAGFMRPLLLIECNIGSGGGDQCASLPNALDVNVTMYGAADNTSSDQDIEKKQKHIAQTKNCLPNRCSAKPSPIRGYEIPFLDF